MSNIDIEDIFNDNGSQAMSEENAEYSAPPTNNNAELTIALNTSETNFVQIIQAMKKERDELAQEISIAEDKAMAEFLAGKNTNPEENPKIHSLKGRYISLVNFFEAINLVK